MTTPLIQVFEAAIREHHAERAVLRSLAAARYDRTIFPTTGQYDWFSGQALYCLVRHIRPEAIVEISTSSGYSTLFMGLALKRNGKGEIRTFEMDPKAAAAAEKNFRRWDVDAFVRLHVGDARKNVTARTGSDASILFLDSLHSEGFARWFLESLVASPPAGALFHMHDIMPPDARVRKFGGPPFPAARKKSVFGRWKDAIRGRAPSDEELPQSAKAVFPPDAANPLPTYDGNDTTEAVFGNRLAAKLGAGDKVYCHHAADRFPELGPREFDRAVVGRQDGRGRPLEWNESLWAYADRVAEAYASL